MPRYPTTFMGYTVDPRSGIIKSPGKFEGEMYYVPYYWDAMLDGAGEEMNDGGLRIELIEEDWKEFPETRGFDYIRLYEGEQGFVFAKLTRKRKR